MNTFNTLYRRFNKEHKEIICQMPSKKLAQEFIDDLVHFLFPVNMGRNMSRLETEAAYNQLQFMFKTLLNPIKKHLPSSVDNLCKKFCSSLPMIYDMLLIDAKGLLQNDPAANSLAEVIIAYPGFYAIAVYRITHALYKLKLPVLPRIISEYAHSRTGIDIHPGASIGKSFFIDHGTGIVIGETTIIKNNVKIYQGVTLGALSVEKKMAKSKRHPTIENNVTIYAGTTILGGDTIVGHDSIIGGNVWLTESVPPYSLVLNKSECIVKNKKTIKK